MIKEVKNLIHRSIFIKLDMSVHPNITLAYHNATNCLLRFFCLTYIDGRI